MQSDNARAQANLGFMLAQLGGWRKPCATGKRRFGSIRVRRMCGGRWIVFAAADRRRPGRARRRRICVRVAIGVKTEESRGLSSAVRASSDDARGGGPLNNVLRGLLDSPVEFTPCHPKCNWERHR